MTLETYPLPVRFSIEGSRGGPQRNRWTFETDVGEPIERRRSTARLERWNFSLPPITHAELATFEAWYDDDLLGGVLPFVWKHPITELYSKWKILDGDPPYGVSNITHADVTLSLQALMLPTSLVQAAYGTDANKVIFVV